MYRTVRYLIALGIVAVAFAMSFIVTNVFYTGPWQVRWALIGLITLGMGFLGFQLAPKLMTYVTSLTRWLELRLHKLPPQEIVGGAVGLITGLIIANLFSSSLMNLPLVGTYLPLVLNIFLAYLGWRVGAHREELLAILGSFYRPSSRGRGGRRETSAVKILDTSVIIDGRIADICRSGFLDGRLLVPSFVLEELRHIADSSDLLKRNRGRRGLDILNRLQEEADLDVEVWEQDFVDLSEVDSKLVRLGQELNASIVTNDYNLNKVASLQGVRVLNINELANALKPVVLPGEEMLVQIIKDGKETGQGVGYLDDGTMIVVEGGRRFIGQTVTVVVTSVLQTAAGRMIFGRPKVVSKKQLASSGEVSAGAW